MQAKLDMPLGMAARTRMRLIVVVITTLTWLFVGSIAFVHLEVSPRPLADDLSRWAASLIPPALCGGVAGLIALCITAVTEFVAAKADEARKELMARHNRPFRP